MGHSFTLESEDAVLGTVERAAVVVDEAYLATSGEHHAGVAGGVEGKSGTP